MDKFNVQAFDDIGDKFKAYEKQYTDIIPFDIDKPIVARLDGCHFSSWTSKYTEDDDRLPYSTKMNTAMQNTTKYLMEQTGATIGYTTSDEITLIWFKYEEKSQMFYNGKTAKLMSTLASMASVKFYEEYSKKYNDVIYDLPYFDCRIFKLDSNKDAIMNMCWRIQDAYRNSISRTAQKFFSHKQLLNKNCNSKLEMLKDIKYEYHKLPLEFICGSVYGKVKKFRSFSSEEIQLLPEKHTARLDPNYVCERAEIEMLTDIFHFFDYMKLESNFTKWLEIFKQLQIVKE